MISIREGTARDRPAIEAVRRASWRAAYTGLIAPEHIERATSGPSGISHPAPWRRTLVAVRDGMPDTIGPSSGMHRGVRGVVPPGDEGLAAVVGYAAFGPERTVTAPEPGSPSAAAGDVPPLTEAGLAGEVGELYAIYTDPAWWSTGTGRSLMAASVRGLQEAGYQRAVLWVLAANARARRFYEIAGWAPDGADNVLAGLGGVLEVRYARSLLA